MRSWELKVNHTPEIVNSMEEKGDKVLETFYIK